MNWRKDLKGKVLLGEPLSKHTTFKIGGPAEFFIKPRDVHDLKLLLRGLKKYKMPILLLGAGSNILVGDKGIKAIVLKLDSPYFKKIIFRHNGLEAGCGLRLRQLVGLTKQRGLTGAEFLAGIPGTVGGALAMNAGAWGKNIGELVEKIRVMDYNGNTKILHKRQLKFGYRSSGLGKYIILNTYLKLSKKNKEEISDNIKECLRRRFATQDNSLPNAGCIFKNPPRESAGRLIDLCGLKGKKIGGAVISKKHANFILNQGHASASDVLRLVDLMRKRVNKRFNLTLQPEIKIWE
jgi:UDP-N-acetylmuramate dehydrogenase